MCIRDSLDALISTLVCFRVLKNNIVDIPAPTAASVNETSMPSNNKNIKAHIKLKTVVAMIAENKSLVNMTYIEMIIRMVNSRYRNVIVIIFSPYYLDVLRMLGVGHV